MAAADNKETFASPSTTIGIERARNRKRASERNEKSSSSSDRLMAGSANELMSFSGLEQRQAVAVAEKMLTRNELVAACELLLPLLPLLPLSFHIRADSRAR